MSRFGLALVLGLVVACSEREARDPETGGLATDAGDDTGCPPLEAEVLMQCAPTYDEELRAAVAKCGIGWPSQATYRCGRYLIVNQPIFYGAGKFCYYDAATKQRVAYAHCNDTPDPNQCGAFCSSAGEQVEVACDAETLKQQAGSWLCPTDGGAAGDTGLAADGGDAASDASQD